jgi:hypothetical protein
VFPWGTSQLWERRGIQGAAALNGKTAPLTKSQWMTLLVNTERPGDRVPVTVLRDAKRVALDLPIQ